MIYDTGAGGGGKAIGRPELWNGWRCNNLLTVQAKRNSMSALDGHPRRPTFSNDERRHKSVQQRATRVRVPARLQTQFSIL